jgi:hypothetical protein
MQCDYSKSETVISNCKCRLTIYARNRDNKSRTHKLLDVLPTKNVTIIIQVTLNALFTLYRCDGRQEASLWPAVGRTGQICTRPPRGMFRRQSEEVTGGWENCVECVPSPDKIKKNETGRTCGTHGKKEAWENEYFHYVHVNWAENFVDLGLCPLERWSRRFESHSRHGCLRAVLCVGSGLATGWSRIYGVLPTLYKITKLKNGQGPTTSRRAIDERIILNSWCKKVVEWTHRAQDRDKWWDVVNTVVNILIP